MAKQPAQKGPVNRPQVVRRNAVTAGEAKDYESRSLSRSRGAPSQPQGRGTLTKGETGDATSKSLRRSQNAKAGRSSATMTPSERGGFETKSLKQARTNPKATSPMTATGSGGKPPSGKPPVATASAKQVVSGSHEMVRPNALPGAAKVGGMAKFMSKVPIIGAIIGAAVGGNAIKDLPGPQKAQQYLINKAAGVTGLAAKEEFYNLSGPAKGVKAYVKPRETAVAPAGQVPAVPPKTISNATPGGSSSPISSNARTGSQKPSGSSKGRGQAMMGAELADYLGLSSSSAVRSNLVKNANKKK